MMIVNSLGGPESKLTIVYTKSEKQRNILLPGT